MRPKAMALDDTAPAPHPCPLAFRRADRTGGLRARAAHIGDAAGGARCDGLHRRLLQGLFHRWPDLDVLGPDGAVVHKGGATALDVYQRHPAVSGGDEPRLPWHPPVGNAVADGQCDGHGDHLRLLQRLCVGLCRARGIWARLKACRCSLRPPPGRLARCWGSGCMAYGGPHLS